MPKRSSKDRDPIRMAMEVLAKATGEPLPEEPAKPQKVKNAAAVELGRLGGLKGGKARAKKLGSEQRVEIAKKAAHARWTRKDTD